MEFCNHFPFWKKKIFKTKNSLIIFLTNLVHDGFHVYTNECDFFLETEAIFTKKETNKKWCVNFLLSSPIDIEQT